MKNVSFKWGWLLLAAILVFSRSCIYEPAAPVIIPPEEGEFEEIVFSIQVPSSGKPATKALEKEDEDAVDELIVLGFATGGGAYRYYSVPQLLEYNAQQGVRKYMVKLRVGEYDLMVLANSRQYIRTCFPDGLEPGTPRADIITGLKAGVGTKWIADPDKTGYASIPMWAMKTGLTISETTDLTGDNGFRLLRAVARINVELDLPAAQQDDFELVDIRFYHYRNTAQIIPNSVNAATGQVTAPSLVGNDDIKGPLLYNGAEITDGGKCENEIYVFEVPEGASNKHPAYPCLVIGGRYKGQLGYYRVDFVNEVAGSKVYMPLLRNHSYNIYIKSVSGEGLPDPDDAYESIPVNIEAKIIAWNEELSGDVYFDGQNYLCLDQGRYKFPQSGKGQKDAANTVFIKTDYKDGWEYTKIEYGQGDPGGWLTFEGNPKGLADINEERWLRTVVNNTGAERTAFVVIKAGRLEGTIKVTQSAVGLDLKIYDMGTRLIGDGEVITYGSDVWTDRTCFYKLEWSPADADVYVTLNRSVPGYDTIEFENEGVVLQSGPLLNNTGQYYFVFGLKRFDTSETKRKGEFWFPEQALEYEFVATYEGQTVTKKFTVVNKLLDVQATKLGPCIQGRFYDIEVRYNTDWELVEAPNARIVMDDESVDRAPQSGAGGAGVIGAPFSVKFRIDKDFDGQGTYLQFKQDGSTNIFDQVDMRGYYNHPNSYLVMPNGYLEFSVIKAFRVWESERINQPLKEDGDLSIELIWGDDGMFEDITANLEVRSPLRESIIRINAGSRIGNVVVGLLLDGEIIWSWHIWVTGYEMEGPGGSITYPTEGKNFTVMTRNLGAEQRVLNSNKTPGLYYQWGRKDPFPSCSRYDSSPPYPGLVGDGGNAVIDWNRDKVYYVGTYDPPYENNLVESIRMPYKFFVPPDMPYDWYSRHGTEYDNTLWRADDMVKTEFDPCPDGWRVPNYYLMDGRAWYTFTFVIEAASHRPYGWEDTDIGTIPNGGYIDHTGRYTSIGWECWFWYGIYDNEDDKRNIRMGLGDRTANDNDGRERWGRPKASAMPLRCEKDEDRYKPAWP